MQFGLIGEHLGHSFSREIHGRLSSDPYELCELRPDELEGFLRRRDFRGVNVTIPYKQAVIPYLDELGESARGAGAVNTIVNRDGKLYGYNTDYYGFIAMAKHAGADFGGARVVILGAGGAAKAVRAAALAMGASEVVNAVRTVRATGQLPIGDPSTFDGCNILVNATPVGMYPRWQEAPVRLEELLPRMDLRAVLDCIYNPLNTSLILDALPDWASRAGKLSEVKTVISERSDRGGFGGTFPRPLGVQGDNRLQTSGRNLVSDGGLYMLVAQAVKARELFVGESIPEEVTQREYERLLRTKRNIVLCGMPSCGKSTIGKALAEATGRRFEDSDSVVELQAGMTIPEIFSREGEEGFRIRETAALESLAPEQGLVIATGGGMPLRAQNLRLMHHNGIICFLRRDLPLLRPGGGRPLSSSRSALEHLYEHRLPLYMAAADVVIDNNGPISETLSKLLELC